MPLFSQHTARFSPDVPLEGTSSRELLKRYQPLETLATGGFGSIEICRDTHLRRRVAIKRIPLINGAGMPASDIMDVLREAHTAAMLQHPNIVQVIDFTHDTAYAYLVMEYVDGMSLAEFLHRVDGHSLTFGEAAAIADALGQALTFAHSNGVLHLDIKPANRAHRPLGQCKAHRLWHGATVVRRWLWLLARRHHRLHAARAARYRDRHGR